MAFHPELFSRISLRVTQGVSIAIACVLFMVIAVFALAAHELAHMERRLTPLVTAELKRTLGRDVRIAAVRVQGWDTVVISDAAIAKGTTFADGTALEAPRTVARMNLVSLAMHRGENPVGSIQQVALQRPTVEVARSKNGTWDFQDIIDRVNKKRGNGTFHAQVLVDDARVAYRDAQGFGTGKAINRDLADVDARLTPMSSTQYRFSVAGNDSQRAVGRISVAGDYASRAGAADITVTANRVAVKEIAKYLPDSLPITFEDGTAALRLSALFRNLPSAEMARRMPTTALTAEVDLRGVGLRFDEMSVPIVAKSGRLRLQHDPARYPQGSKLELIGVKATADTLPVEVAGTVSEINLFDLAHANPQFDVMFKTTARDGHMLTHLFPDTPWIQQVDFAGQLAIDGRLSGRRNDLRIEGNIDSNRLAVNDLDAEDIHTAFRLRPAAPAGNSTFSMEGRVGTAQVDTTHFSGIRFSASSHAPWKQLADQFLVQGNAQAKRITLPWGEANDVASDFIATKHDIALNSLRGEILGGKVTGSAIFPLYGKGLPDERVRIDAAYTDLDLALLGRQFGIDELSGYGDGTLTMSLLPNQGMRIDTRLRGQDVIYRGYRAPSVSTTLRAESHQGALALDLTDTQVTSDYGRFSIAHGSYTRQGANDTLSLPIVGEDIPLQRFTEDLHGEASLQGTLSGDISSPDLTGRISAKNGTFRGHAYTEGHGDIRLHGKDLRMTDVTFTRPGVTVSIPGGADGFDPRGGLYNMPITLAVDGAPLQDVLDLLELKSPWQIDGKTQGTAQIRLTPAGTVASGEAVIPNAVVHIPTAQGTYPVDLKRLGLLFDLEGRTLQVKRLSALRGETELVTTGTVLCPQDEPVSANLTFTGDKAWLEDLPQDLFGIPVSLSGQADIAGQLTGALNGSGREPLTVDVTAKAPQMAVEGLDVGQSDVALRYLYRPNDRQLLIRHGTVSNDAFQATTSGEYDLSGEKMSGVKVDLTQLDLARFQQMLRDAQGSGKVAMISGMAQALPQLAGQGRVNITADGHLSHPNATLGLNLVNGKLGATPLPNLHAQLATEPVGNRYAIRIDEAVAEGGAGEGRAQFSGRIEPNGVLDLRFSADDITAAVLKPWIGISTIDGRASFAGKVRGRVTDPVAESRVEITEPVIAGHRIHLLAGDLRYADQELSLNDGEVWLTRDSQPLTVQGHIPVQQNGMTFALAQQKALDIDATLPRQNLAIVRAFLPGMPDVAGTIEGRLHVGGTPAAPRVTDGRFAVAGSATLPKMDRAYPNVVNDIDLRVNVTGDQHRSQVTVERLSAILDRIESGQRAKGFLPGMVASEGSITIPMQDLRTPNHWQWDLYTRVSRLPLSPELFLVPQVSGFLHLQNEAGGTPVLRGVLLAENAKIKQPKISTSGSVSWGPFEFSPRLSVVLQIGQRVKLAQSIVRVPLLPTPLPWPGIEAVAPNTLPSVEIDRTDPAYNYNADMLNPGTSAELSGTWGVLTGTLNTPQLYARFEADKKKLAFPFNLFSSIRKARGHITYSLADGPKITMGIPEFQQTPVTKSEAPVTQVPKAGSSPIAQKDVKTPEATGASTTPAASVSTPPAADPVPAQ